MMKWTAIIKNLLLLLGWGISLYCFIQTSTFGDISYVTGSMVKAVLFISVLSGLLVFVLWMAGAGIKHVVHSICLILCLPAVLAGSKINWIEILWKVKVESKLNTAVTGTLVSMVALFLIVAYFIDQFEQNSLIWIGKGAAEADVKEILSMGIWGMLYTVGITSIPLVVVIGFGTLLARMERSWEPSFLVLSGVLLAGIGLFYWLRINDNKKV